jgi:nitrogen fixation/metabolism regulation signal transduction histidine kinase
VPNSTRSKITLAGLAAALLLLLLVLGALNAFNLPRLSPGSTAALFLFAGVTSLIFLLLLMLLVLFARNILRLYADQRSRVLGSRLRTRMLVGALLLSFAPTLFMFLFSYLLMNRSIDRWFSEPVSRLRDDSTRIALELSHYVAGNARSEAEALARSTAFSLAYEANDARSLASQIRTHRVTLEGGFVVVYRDGAPLATYQLPTQIASVTVRPWLDRDSSAVPESGTSLVDTVLKAGRRGDEPVLDLGLGPGGQPAQYALGTSMTTGGGLVVVALPLPGDLSDMVGQIGSAARQYSAVYRQRRTIRTTYLLMLLLLTVLTFFASSWLALYLSKQITRPVEALADAMDEIAAGDYRQRVNLSATEELGDLVGSFNQMAADLEQSRRLADSSTLQLSAANRSLEERRRELERILETIPSGVAVLDAGRRVLQVNRAFLELFAAARPATGAQLQPGSTAQQLPGSPAQQLEEILPLEITEEIIRLSRRAQRMGVAGAELELRPAGAEQAARSLSVTIAVLELGADRRGSILVVEDVSEVLEAQRQVAWKEVAQRVAHEIKNPLTPIALSAERIRRHVDRNAPDSSAVIRKCAEVILGSVESMRTLVDQFAALAQFPAAQPRPANLNQIAESALLLFHGRLENIRIDLRLDPALPPILADPEALKRALANLIDNAAEAMQESLLRVLTLETRQGERPGMAELVLSDTGPGLSAEVRERLFLPYFSTKQRGTGLGLPIAAKIIQDHNGAIRAEQNSPAGASFIVEIPYAEPAQLTPPAPRLPARASA